MYNYWDEYDTIIIVIPDYESCDVFFDYIKENLPEYFNKMGKDVKTNMQHYLDQGKEPYSRYDKESDRFKQATTTLIPNLDQKYERLFYVKDLPKLKNIILGTNVPNYKPRKRVLESVNEDIKIIVIRIDNIEEYNLLKTIGHVYDYRSIPYPNWFFIHIKEKNTMICPWDDIHSDYDGAMDYINNSIQNIHKHIYTIKDIDLIKRMMDTGRIIQTKPSYAPRRKRVLENLNESQFHPSYDFNSILITIKNSGELQRAVDYFTYKDIFDLVEIDDFELGIMERLDSGDECYLRIRENGKLRFSSLYMLRDNVQNSNITYEKLFTMDDVENGVLDNIYTYGKSDPRPSYTPKKRNINEGVLNPNYNYGHIVILINNREDLEESGKYLSDFKDWDIVYRNILNDIDIKPYYIRIYNNNYIDNGIYLGRGSQEFLYSDSFKRTYDYEKFFTVDDLKNGLINSIQLRGEYVTKPNYKPKKFDRTLENVNEGIKSNDYKQEHQDIIITFNSLEELEESKEYLNSVEGFKLAYEGLERMLSNDVKQFILIHIDTIGNYYIDNRGTLKYLDYIKSRYNYEKIFTITDLRQGLLNNIKTYGIIKPKYSPKKFDTTMAQWENNTFTTEQLLLEKSSLTNLGVPREVMQPIQKDFAIPADATWDRMTLKRDVDTLFRKGDKELLLQISIDYIKVFVSQYGKYFVDTYVMKDSGWGGEYEKLDRENVSLTQLLYQIEPKTLLYNLKSDFSTQKQGKRKLIKKEKDFESFTNKFKEDFLKDFNSILRRIVGSKYKDAKKEIQDKAKQIEMENQMMISGLDDSLAGPNSMTILDNFISEFEEAYSDFFGEYLDIQELSQHFTREKIMTSFMYFIYTGKLLEK